VIHFPAVVCTSSPSTVWSLRLGTDLGFGPATVEVATAYSVTLPNRPRRAPKAPLGPGERGCALDVKIDPWYFVVRLLPWVLRPVDYVGARLARVEILADDLRDRRRRIDGADS
jgi:hypothetical protein